MQEIDFGTITKTFKKSLNFIRTEDWKIAIG